MRPAATRISSATTEPPSSSVTVTRRVAADRRRASTPTRTSRPSRRSTSVSSSLVSGSSGARIGRALRPSSPGCRTGRTPGPARARSRRRRARSASAGSSRTLTTSRLVHGAASARPGTAGSPARCRWRGSRRVAATYTSSPTATRPGPSSTPPPRTNVPPLPTKRSTATWSFQSSVASSRMRSATMEKSGSTVARPAMPSIRRASASRSAARMIIFDGMQP